MFFKEKDRQIWLAVTDCLFCGGVQVGRKTKNILAIIFKIFLMIVCLAFFGIILIATGFKQGAAEDLIKHVRGG